MFAVSWLEEVSHQEASRLAASATGHSQVVSVFPVFPSPATSIATPGPGCIFSRVSIGRAACRSAVAVGSHGGHVARSSCYGTAAAAAAAGGGTASTTESLCIENNMIRSSCLPRQTHVQCPCPGGDNLRMLEQSLGQAPAHHSTSKMGNAT